METVMLFGFSICILSIFIVYFRRNVWKKPTNLPTLRSASWHFLKSVFSLDATAGSLLFFQIQCAMAKLFQDEGIYMLTLLSRSTVTVYKAEYVKELINHPAANDKSEDYELMKFFVGDGLLGRNGHMGRNRRKLLTPAFHLFVLKSFIPIFNEHSSILVSKLKMQVHKLSIELDPIIYRCALDIICDSVMGYKLNAQNGVSGAKKFIKASERLRQAYMYRVLKPWAHYDALYHFLPEGRIVKKHMEIARDVITMAMNEKRASFFKRLESVKSEDAENKIFPDQDRKVLLEHLLEYHVKDPAFTLNEVKEEAEGFINGGSDTVAKALLFSTYMIGLHPDIQEKAALELKAIFGDDKERDCSYDDLQKMEYLTCVIKETLRLYPSAPLVTRELKESLKIGNYTLPRGATVIFLFYMLHRDPKMFPNPEKFDPERFLNQNGNLHPHAFLPFSAGSRNCIGLKFSMIELKIILSHVLRNFKITSLTQRDEINVTNYVTLKNLTKLKVKLTARE